MDKDLQNFIELLKKDIKKFNSKLNYYFHVPKGSMGESDFHFNFDLFKGCVKEYCFQENIVEKTVHVNVDLKGKIEERLIKRIEIPKDRINYFKKFFFNKFDMNKEIRLYAYFGSSPINHDIEELYLRFFYKLYHDYHFFKKDLYNIFLLLYNDWKKTIKYEKIKVKFYFPIDGYYLFSRKKKKHSFLTLEQFSMEYLYGSPKKVLGSFPPPKLFLIHVTELPIKLSQNLVSITIIEDMKIKLKIKYKRAIRRLYLLIGLLNSQYIKCKWQEPYIEGPWWYETKNKFKKLFKEPFFSRKHKKFSHNRFKKVVKIQHQLERKGYFEKNSVLFDSYFRYSQQPDINSYYFFDVFTFFEAIFTRGTNETKFSSFRLRFNAACFFAKNIEEFWKIYYFFRDLYVIRSKAVHGEGWSSIFEKIIRNEYNIQNVKKSPQIIKKFHSKILSYVNSLFTDEINNFLKKSKEDIKISQDPLYFYRNSQFYKNKDLKRKILNRLKKNYKDQKYNYKNQWEEITDQFNFD